MNGNRRFGEAAQRNAERRQREDDAGRLATEVPDLATLRLDIDEHVNGSPCGEPAHIRRIPVESAPALFVLNCGDPRCKDGGHDITHAIMRELRGKATTFDGKDECRGSLGTSNCPRVLHFVATATYKP
jgi:hypothetical protein